MSCTNFFLRFKPFYFILLSLFLLFSGCAHKKNFSPSTRDKKAPKYTSIGYLTSIKDTSINDNIDHGVLSGIIYGAKPCFIPGAFTAGEGGALLGGVYLIVCLPIGTTVGATVGAYESKQLDSTKKEKGTIQARINISSIYKKIQNISVSYSHDNNINVRHIETIDMGFKENNNTDYSILDSKGIDTIIEFEIDEIMLDETGIVDTPIFITLKVSAKSIKTSDGTIIDTTKRKINSDIHSYEEWIADNFKLLDKEFNTLLEIVVSSIIDEFLLVYYPTLPKELVETENQKKPERHAPYYVLSAYYPEPTYRFGDIRELFSDKYEIILAGSPHQFTLIKEQQPFLKWESFPWTYDQISKKEFTDIVYDLKIYKYRGSLVYTRKGLKHNSHQVEDLLHLNTKYLWTVRARFNLDGKPRATEWGGLYDLYRPAWTFGDDSNDWNIKYWPLSSKKYLYYPFMIIEE